MIEINLLPGAAHKTKSGSGSFHPTALFAGLNERFRDKYFLGASAAVAAGVVAIAAMFLYQLHQEQRINAHEAAVARDSSRFAVVLAARHAAETTRDSVYQQLAIIKSIDDSRYTWPHILEEINLALPPYTWLTSIVQTSAITTAAGNRDTSTKKGVAATVKQKVTPTSAAKQRRMHADSLFSGEASAVAFRIIGQTVDIQALTRFMKSLEASPFIRNVQLTRSDLVTAGNQTVTEFQLEAETEIPPPSLIQTVPLTVAVH